MAAPGSFSPSNGLDGKTLVLQAVDLVQLIGQTVALKKRGNRYTGLCPFHNEKSPSFGVDPDKGFYHCFGCKKSGNAIDFVMERDRLEFRDALHQLADQYHVELPKSGNGQREPAGFRQALLDACSAAATYYEQILHSPAGAAARAYLAERGFNDETIKRFRLGLAPDGWDNLARSPLLKKFKPELLHQAGLLKAGEKRPGFYDTFRQRLMFPIRDEGGRVIAFGGRVMPGNTSPAKYLNSPETPLFSKSKVAYGLDLGRQKVVDTKTVAVVEGYTDVVMAHQFGASNVVSVLGTALTEQHVNLLRRFAGRIVLLFDGDSAGDLAVTRALELFLTQPIEIGIATLPDGVDPDEYLLRHGVDGFDKLLAGAEDALTFQWRQMSRRYRASGTDLTAQSKAVEEYLQQIANARGTATVDPIRWGATILRLSRLTGLEKEDLNRRFPAPRNLAPLPKPPYQPGNRSPFQPGQKPAFGPKKPYGNKPGFGPSKPSDGPPPYASRDDRPRPFVPFRPSPEPGAPKNPAPPRPAVSDGRRRAERWIMGGLLHFPQAWPEIQQIVSAEEFMSEDLRPLALWYWDHQRNEGQPELGEVIALLDSGPLKTLAIELASEADTLNNRQTLVDAVKFVQGQKLRQAEIKLLGDLKRTTSERQSEADEVDVLRKLEAAAGKRSAKAS